MLHKYLLVFASVCSLWLPAAAQAEKWPDKPVTFIVPFPAGGSMDTFSRPVAKKLGEYLGVPVIISNRAGAGGGVGLSALARAPTDGYPRGMGSGGNIDRKSVEVGKSVNVLVE